MTDATRSDRVTYRVLDAQRAPVCAPMTFPRFRGRLQALDAQTLALEALADDQPVGLVVAHVDAAARRAELLSIFTDPNGRRRGIASGLLEALLRELGVRGYAVLHAVYERNRPYSEAVEHLLARRGASQPQVRSLVCRCNGSDLRRAPWLHKHMLPASFEIFLWRDLSPDDRTHILERQRACPWFPEILSPFRETDLFEPLNSLGLRYRGEVVGWQINHRIARDTIRYTAMFVRDDLQPFGLAIPLMIESIRRHIFSGQLWINKATFAVPYTQEGMVRFVQKHMLPFMSQVNDSVESVLPVGSRI